jgi:hypothetical protein
MVRGFPGLARDPVHRGDRGRDLSRQHGSTKGFQLRTNWNDGRNDVLIEIPEERFEVYVRGITVHRDLTPRGRGVSPPATIEWRLGVIT